MNGGSIGLYDPSYEHDACGVGMAVNIDGRKEHRIVEYGLQLLENMAHRGAENGDGKTGDGSGILVQIPHEFIRKLRIPVPEAGRYGTGLFFLPQEGSCAESCMALFREVCADNALYIIAERDVPVDHSVPGPMALEGEPRILQVFVTSYDSPEVLEHKLYRVRKQVSNRIAASGSASADQFYICSLSTRCMVYKGMLTPEQLRDYYLDLSDPDFDSAIAMVHSRFSTNTLPAWKLAQPFRMLCHNGEINTIRSNRSWMQARESVMESELLPDIQSICPIMQSGMSDSATLDNVFEFLTMSGKEMPNALSIMIPESWNDKRVFIHFDGVYSAAVVWVNGKYVGYSQGSNTDAEFDLTGFVTTGDNQLSVRVYRWCDGSYLEGQDMWHLSGIHRDVYLVATPKVFVSDHYITSSLNTAATSGSMSVKLTVDNRNTVSANKTLQVSLLDRDGKEIATGTATYSKSSTAEKTVTLSGLSNLHPWSAEDPYLYTVVVSQKDENGAEEMAFSTKYGFKTVTISGTKLLVNGKRIFVKGVNTQDTHPEYGRAIDMETMLKDIKMMKQANVNTIRTSHYPRQPKMYAMMDAYGLYCVNEADVECHGNQGLASNSSWQTAITDREVRMVKRDRNHPSVLFWSLGNECGAASNFSSAKTEMKKYDSRPIFYCNEDNIVDYSDLHSNMYPSVDATSSKSNGYNGKPYFICEYAHAMGQAVGNLKEYWDVIESSNGIIGGCIWDWVDQSIYKPSDLVKGTKTKNGFHNWTAGYDYNSIAVNWNPVTGFQGNFLNNGIITPDRAWTSKLTEVKKVYSNVTFSKNGNTLTVKNKNSFIDLSGYMLTYQLLCDGCLKEEGILSTPSATAGNSAYVTLPSFSTDNDHEYLLNVQLRLKNSTLWADAGYIVADEQFSLTGRKEVTAGNHTANGGSVSVSRNTVNITTKDGKKSTISFSNGKLNSWNYNGTDLIYAAPDFNSYRDIDNDRWSGSFQKSTSTSVTSKLTKEGNVAKMSMSGGNIYTIDYIIYPDATIDMKVTFNSSSNYRRVGLGMQFTGGFENVEYYARGPWSNYVDRKTGSYLGRYVTTVDDMIEENIHPQTYGDHQDLRELILSNGNVALTIKTGGNVAYSLSHYDETQYCGTGDTMWSDGTHWYDLTKSNQIFAHFDYWQRGLGNGSCGGDSCLNKYLCPSGSYSYTLRFTPTSLK